MTEFRLILPPSETKCAGGSSGPLDLAALAFEDALGGVRKELLDALTELAADPAGTRAALGISERQHEQVLWNTQLWTSPTAPALGRYTGVLYDALGYATLPPAARQRADASLHVASALFGLVRATDQVPAYRLSAGSVLPEVGSLGALWRPVLAPVLADLSGLVVDLRSSSYAALAPAPGAVAVRVLTTDGKVVSHWSKHYKGVLARALLRSRATIDDVPSLLRAGRRAGLTVTRAGERRIDLVVSP